MSQHSRRSPSVNPSEPSDNGPPPDADAHEPDEPTTTGPAEQPGLEKPPDPFAPESLRNVQNFGAGIGANRPLLNVPVRKPAKSAWIRVHPDAAYHIEAVVLEDKEEDEIFWVAPTILQTLTTDKFIAPFLVAKALYIAITRQGTVFVWGIRLPGSDGKTDDWSLSAHEAAERAVQVWVRVTANLELGSYEVAEMLRPAPDPVWPKNPPHELLRIAFRGRVVETLDHPKLRKLRGES
jgi:hypothetical protein